MSRYLAIDGGARLIGTVQVSGAKNAALPLLIASILTPELCTLRNIPALADIVATLELLESLGARYRYQNHQVQISMPRILRADAPHALVKSLRASFWILGPLLARHGIARVTLPGGDAIGSRPVDMHLAGLIKMGAEIRIDHGIVDAIAPQGLRPAHIVLDYPSVGATHQLLMAASATEGLSVIENAAKEPELVELARFLSLMGAEISGAGTSIISIRGVKELGGATVDVLGDRIEAATYLMAGAVTQGDVCVTGIDPESLRSTLQLMQTAGCDVECCPGGIRLRASGPLKAVDVSTNPFPGLASDVQPMVLACLTRAVGVSTVSETVFDNRFGHVREYRKFGADITVTGNVAEVRGVSHLRPATVEAADIRAAAGLVLMGLMAEGQSIVRDVHHLVRGYESMDQKLASIGANIRFVQEYGSREVVVGC